MLSREENTLLTQVHAGSPMGAVFRRYWIPALLTEEIAEPDCSPVRVRLLCEDLVAFRTSDGKIGLLGEHCAHRGTSLFFGRNRNAVCAASTMAGSMTSKAMCWRPQPSRPVAN